MEKRKRVVVVPEGVSPADEDHVLEVRQRVEVKKCVVLPTRMRRSWGISDRSCQLSSSVDS